MTTRTLRMSWSTSKGADTYGWNICRLDDMQTGKRYRTSGGGYDMQGTVFAQWLQDTHQAELLSIIDQADTVWDAAGRSDHNEQGLYGFTVQITAPGEARARLDGACGLSSIERVAKALGLKVRHEVNRRGNVVGFIVDDNR